MSVSDVLLRRAFVYRLWQAPFAKKKMRPIIERNCVNTASAVLDLGCGPGTNAGYFKNTRYVGIDMNVEYVAAARRTYGMTFIAGDATYSPLSSGQFDFVLVNSLLHHLDDVGVNRVLDSIAPLLMPDGRVHILELVMPGTVSAARLLARLDRGRHARSRDHWRALFTVHFVESDWEPFRVGIPGLPLWEMVYFSGYVRSV